MVLHYSEKSEKRENASTGISSGVDINYEVSERSVQIKSTGTPSMERLSTGVIHL